MDKIDIKKWLKKYDIVHYKINDDLSIDVVGDVNLYSVGLCIIPVKFGNVSGNFNCGMNKLTSLEGCPVKVGGFFDCSYNKLTSLEGCPTEVGGYFSCGYNELVSLLGCPRVGGDFNCCRNKLFSLEGCPVTNAGLMGVIYLEIMDASFSFDGVIGAFAVSKDIVIIMVGLAIGAMAVRSLTVLLVKEGTLQKYKYLEHGAHYAVVILAFIMLIGMIVHISEVITGLTGVAFIAFALWSSIRYNKTQLLNNVDTNK